MDLPDAAQPRSEGIGGSAMESTGKSEVATATVLVKREEEVEEQMGSLALCGGDGSNRFALFFFFKKKKIWAVIF